MKPRETEIASKLIAWLQSKDEANERSIHAEVVMPDGIADVVCIDGHDWAEIFECKAHGLTYELFAQCVKRAQYANRVFAVIPLAPGTEAKEHAIQHFSECGFGVIQVGERVSIVRGAAARQGFNSIVKYCNDANRVGAGWAAAGSKDERRATGANIAADQVERYVAANPGCTFIEVKRALNIIRFGSWSNFHRMIAKGVYRLREETVHGKTALYPLEEVANV